MTQKAPSLAQGTPPPSFHSAYSHRSSMLLTSTRSICPFWETSLEHWALEIWGLSGMRYGWCVEQSVFWIGSWRVWLLWRQGVYVAPSGSCCMKCNLPSQIPTTASSVNGHYFLIKPIIKFTGFVCDTKIPALSLHEASSSHSIQIALIWQWFSRNKAHKNNLSQISLGK